MDPTELRLRKIELTLRAVETLVALQSHRRIAVLGVSLTLAGGASLGALVGQLPARPAALVVLATGAVVADQVRSLRKVSVQWGNATEEAIRSVDKLMALEVESDADDQERQPG